MSSSCGSRTIQVKISKTLTHNFLELSVMILYSSLKMISLIEAARYNNKFVTDCFFLHCCSPFSFVIVHLFPLLLTSSLCHLQPPSFIVKLFPLSLSTSSLTTSLHCHCHCHHQLLSLSLGWLLNIHHLPFLIVDLFPLLLTSFLCHCCCWPLPFIVVHLFPLSLISSFIVKLFPLLLTSSLCCQPLPFVVDLFHSLFTSSLHCQPLPFVVGLFPLLSASSFCCWPLPFVISLFPSSSFTSSLHPC